MALIQREFVFGVDEQDKPRLNQQALLILERLRQGPAYNFELARYALSYTARIADLRLRGGYNIINTKRPDLGKGVSEFRLEDS